MACTAVSREEAISRMRASIRYKRLFVLIFRSPSIKKLKWEQTTAFFP